MMLGNRLDLSRFHKSHLRSVKLWLATLTSHVKIITFQWVKWHFGASDAQASLGALKSVDFSHEFGFGQRRKELLLIWFFTTFCIDAYCNIYQFPAKFWPVFGVLDTSRPLPISPSRNVIGSAALSQTLAWMKRTCHWIISSKAVKIWICFHYFQKSIGYRKKVMEKLQKNCAFVSFA